MQSGQMIIKVLIFYLGPKPASVCSNLRNIRDDCYQRLSYCASFPHHMGKHCRKACCELANNGKLEQYIKEFNGANLFLLLLPQMCFHQSSTLRTTFIGHYLQLQTCVVRIDNCKLRHIEFMYGCAN